MADVDPVEDAVEDPPPCVYGCPICTPWEDW